MRVYLPATLDELQHGSPVLLGPRRVHVVTPALRVAWPDEDEEGWEYAAQSAAADDSHVLLARQPDAPPLRVVVAADLAPASVEDVAEPDVPSLARTVTEVGLDAVVSVHVDEPAAAADVRAALSGDEAPLERLEEHDLLWYDVSEIGLIPRP